MSPMGGTQRVGLVSCFPSSARHGLEWAQAGKDGIEWICYLAHSSQSNTLPFGEGRLCGTWDIGKTAAQKKVAEKNDNSAHKLGSSDRSINLKHP